MKRLNGLILWPAYFDSSKKRSQGRRVPVRLALDNPTSAELVETCRALSLKALPQEGERYPRSWWDDADPVLVETAGTKSKLLLHVAAKMRELRLSSERKAKEQQKKPRRK